MYLVAAKTLQKTEIQREHLVRTVGNGGPCTRYVSHTVYLTHGNSKGEGRSRGRHKNNS